MQKNSINKRIIEKIISIFSWLSLILAILVAILTIFASLTSDKNGKEIFGYKMLIVASDSMSKSPLSENELVFFEAGDLILVKTIKSTQEFNVGDVISFVSFNPDSYGKTLTHKIREINYSQSGKLLGYTTYGINTGVSDKALVSPESIIGVYYKKIPKLGSVFSFLKTPKGYFLSILSPFILLIIFFSIRVGKYLGKKEALNELKNFKDNSSLSKRVNLLEERLNNLLNLDSLNSEQKTEIGVNEIAITKEKKQTLNFNSYKVSFIKKLIRLDQDAQNYFHTIHTEFISYKNVKDKISYKCASYRIGRKLLAKATICGKTLKLHLALDITSFNKNVFFQKDLSNFKAYELVPFTVKIKSPRAEKNAVKLIEALMKENNVEKTINEKTDDTLTMENEIYNLELSSDNLNEATENNKQSLIINANKISFKEKLLRLDNSIKEYFNTIHNEFISYKKVKDRVSFRYVSYRIGKKLLAKISIRGKTLKLHLALDITSFNKNVFFQKDLSNVKAYEQVPFTVKVKSARAEKNAVKLIEALMEQNNVIKK